MNEVKDSVDFYRNLWAGAESRLAESQAEVARLRVENDRAWTAANRAEAKVRGWEATVVCTGLPIRLYPVNGWGPGEGGTVEVPQITPEKLTRILDRIAASEAEVARLRAALVLARDGLWPEADAALEPTR